MAGDMPSTGQDAQPMFPGFRVKPPVAAIPTQDRPDPNFARAVDQQAMDIGVRV
jgi:hypothetical protein